MEYQTLVTRLTVVPEGEPIFHEYATHIEIDDEAAGEFVLVKQQSGFVRIDVGEWEALKAAIDRVISNCRA